MGNAAANQGSGFGWVGPLLLAALAAVLVIRLQDRGPQPGAAGDAGQPLPDLTLVEGWLNVPEGATREALATSFREGLVLVDCWATWCGPCRASLPHLANFKQAYGPKGVKLVGLTDEPAADVPKMERLIAATPGFDWPVAYGADDFMQRMRIQGIPTLILFDQGQAVWTGLGMGAVRDVQPVLDELLARQ